MPRRPELQNTSGTYKRGRVSLDLSESEGVGPTRSRGELLLSPDGNPRSVSSLDTSHQDPHQLVASSEQGSRRHRNAASPPYSTDNLDDAENRKESQSQRISRRLAAITPAAAKLTEHLKAEIEAYGEAELNLESLLAASEASREKTSDVVRSRAPQLTEEVLRLNVGGEVFVVPLKTLLERDANTLFHAMLTTRDARAVPIYQDEHGVVFIDRDPQIFRLVLNYLRGYTHFHMLEENQLQKLKVDAHYYQLSGLLELLGEAEQTGDLQFQSGPGVNPERNRLRVVYGVSIVGDVFLVTGRHRITFEVKMADYVGIGIVSDACVNTDQEFHKTANCCVYYMTGVFYANFPHHRKEENLEKIESGDFVSMTVDMDRGLVEYTLKNSSKIVSVGNARRLRFAVTMKLGSRVRIVPEEEVARLPMYQRSAQESVGSPYTSASRLHSGADDFVSATQLSQSGGTGGAGPRADVPALYTAPTASSAQGEGGNTEAINVGAQMLMRSLGNNAFALHRGFAARQGEFDSNRRDSNEP